MMDATQMRDNLCRLAAGIAAMFGENCETVVHEIHGDHLTNIAINNGHVSGRSVGSTRGIFDHSMIDTSQLGIDHSQDVINQLVQLPHGRQIKSSTFIFRGDGYEYALGINFDITVMQQMNGLLSNLIQADGDLFETMQRPVSGSQREQLFQEALSKVQATSDTMNKDTRQRLIKLLQQTNFFALQRSVPFLAEQLGVSKYTIYKDLKAID